MGPAQGSRRMGAHVRTVPQNCGTEVCGTYVKVPPKHTGRRRTFFGWNGSGGEIGGLAAENNDNDGWNEAVENQLKAAVALSTTALVALN